MTRPIQAAVLEGYGLQCLRENFTVGVGRGLKAVPAPDFTGCGKTRRWVDPDSRRTVPAPDFSPGSGFLNPREHSGTSIEGFSPGGGASNSVPRDGRCVCNPLRPECTFLKGTAFRAYVIASDTDPALAAEGRLSPERSDEWMLVVPPARFWPEWDTTALDVPFLSLGAKPRDLRFPFQFSRKLPRQYICD
jgi:hypothetical protein